MEVYSYFFPATCAVQSGGNGGGGSAGNSLGESDPPNAHRGPYFDTNASKNITALLGKTAYLNCRVKNLSNKTVSTYIGILII